MAEDTTTTDTSATSGESSNSETVQTGTQANTQVDAVQAQPNPLDSQTTSAVSVVKPPEPKKVEPTLEQLASKLDYNDMIAKHIDGSISKEDFEAIEKAGLSVSQFKMLAEAQKAIQLKNNDTLYNLVGGQKSYENLKSFAAEHLSDEDIDGFNSALKSGNMKIAEMAVLGLKAMAEREQGKHPERRISSNGGAVDSTPAYSTQQELIKDLNSRAYRIDPAFKAKVDSRRAKSGF